MVATLLFALRLRLQTKRLELAVKRHTSLASLVAIEPRLHPLGNLEGEITYLNWAAKSLVGLDELEGGPPPTLYDFFPPEEVQNIRNEVVPTLLRDGWVRTEINLRHFRTGRLIPVDIGGVVIGFGRSPHRSWNRHARPHRDAQVSKPKAHLEMQLAQAQKMEALGRLTGGIAHDFNNSLTVILGYAGVLENSEQLSERDRKALAAIKGAGPNSKSLVKQLMGFSRQQVIAPQVLNLNQELRESEPLLPRLVGKTPNSNLYRERLVGRVSRLQPGEKVLRTLSQMRATPCPMAANSMCKLPTQSSMPPRREVLLLIWANTFCCR